MFCFIFRDLGKKKTLEISFKDKELLRQGTKKEWTSRRTARSDEDLTAHSNYSIPNTAK